MMPPETFAVGHPRDSATQRWLGLAAMGTACTIWGLGPIWIRTLLDYLPALDICLFRVLLGGLTLLPWLLACDRTRLVTMLRHPATWLGGAAIAAGMLAYASALNFIRPAEVNLMFQISIVTSALLGLWVFHESVPRRRWLAFAVVLAGVTLVILARDESQPVAANWALRLGGMGLGLLGGLGSSVIQMLMRHVAEDGVGLPASVVMHWVAALIFAVTAQFQIAWHQPPDSRFLLNMLLLGVFGSGVGSGLAYFAVRRISLAQMGITGAMQPVVTILAAALMGELLPPLGLLGGAAVVGGVIASARMERHVRNLKDAPLADIPSLTGAS